MIIIISGPVETVQLLRFWPDKFSKGTVQLECNVTSTRKLRACDTINLASHTVSTRTRELYPCELKVVYVYSYANLRV